MTLKMYALQETVLVTKSMDEALEILQEIEDNVNTCCAITMEPEEVAVLIDRLREVLIKLKEDKNEQLLSSYMSTRRR